MLKPPKKVTQRKGENSLTIPMKIFPGCGPDACADRCVRACQDKSTTVLDFHTATNWATSWV